MISYGLDLIVNGAKSPNQTGDLISPSWFCSGRNDSQIIHLAGLCRVPEHVAGPEIMLATFFFLLLTRRYSESGSWSVMGGPVVPHWYLDHWDPCLQSTVREVADGLLNNPLVSSAPWLDKSTRCFFMMMMMMIIIIIINNNHNNNNHNHNHNHNQPTLSLPPTVTQNPAGSTQFALRSLLPGSQLIPVKPTPSGGRWMASSLEKSPASHCWWAVGDVGCGAVWGEKSGEKRWF